MVNYTATVYKTSADAVTAINAAAAGKVSQVVAFMEDGKQKFMVVIAA
jgi:hypothetical protein